MGIMERASIAVEARWVVFQRMEGWVMKGASYLMCHLCQALGAYLLALTLLGLMQSPGRGSAGAGGLQVSHTVCSEAYFSTILPSCASFPILSLSSSVLLQLSPGLQLACFDPDLQEPHLSKLISFPWSFSRLERPAPIEYSWTGTYATNSFDCAFCVNAVADLDSFNILENGLDGLSSQAGTF